MRECDRPDPIRVWVAVLGLALVLGRATAGEAVLLAEDFGRPDALSAWQTVVGAQVGTGSTSVASLDDGALRLHVAPTDQRFVSLQQTVAVPPGSELLVTLRMRTKGVDPGPARFDNCDLYVRVGDGPIDATRVLFGDNAWTPLRRRFAVPPAGAVANVGLFLSMPGDAWFDDVRVEAVPPLRWNVAQDGPYEYRWLDGDDVSLPDRQRNAATFERVRAWLGVAAPPRVTYWKYPDPRTKEEVTGDGGNGHAGPDAIHTVWPVDAHEVVHVLTRRWGDAPALVAEGLAVHLSGAWQGRPVADYARDLVAQGRWVPLDELYATSDFRAHPDLVTYAEAGAFAEWLARKGPAPFRLLYERTKAGGASAEDRAAFQAVVGMDLATVDREVRGWLASGVP